MENQIYIASKEDLEQLIDKTVRVWNKSKFVFLVICKVINNLYARICLKMSFFGKDISRRIWQAFRQLLTSGFANI